MSGFRISALIAGLVAGVVRWRSQTAGPRGVCFSQSTGVFNGHSIPFHCPDFGDPGIANGIVEFSNKSGIYC